jgi:hypothetical protein
MGTDLARIVHEMASFYDFAGKAVIVAGAGEGRLVDYVKDARRVIAVDEDPKAMQRLKQAARARRIENRFDFQAAEFRTVLTKADAVVFEFCLHEMAEPKDAVDHAGTLAPDVIVIDHAPGSLWSWYAGEEAGVDAAWGAIEEESVRKRREVEGVQRFTDFAELASRLASQESVSRERIETLREQQPIAIPMPYRLVLL